MTTLGIGCETARFHNAGRGSLTFTIAQVDPRLLIVPLDTPRRLDGLENQPLTICLPANAKEQEYRFVLRTDAPSERVVVVRVLNMDAIRQARSEFAQHVMLAMSRELADPKKTSALAALRNKDQVYDETVWMAFDAISKQYPSFPVSATSLMAADVFAHANWPQLAAAALRRTEAASAMAARTPSAQSLAGLVAKDLGNQQIFLKAPTGPAPKPDNKPFGWIESKPQAEDLERLANRLKMVPNLRAMGLSLEGDVFQFKGNNASALRAYQNAAAIDSTPSVTARIEALYRK